jgi:hypothetical protein
MAVWYSWQESGTSSTSEEDKYGLLRYGQLNPSNPNTFKPSYNALKRVNQIFNGYQFENNIAVTMPAMGVQLYKPSGLRKVRGYVAWSSDDYNRSVFLPMQAGTWQATDLVNGNQWTVTVSAGSGGTTVSLGAHPVGYTKISTAR